jgi:hypothetical protein
MRLATPALLAAVLAVGAAARPLAAQRPDTLRAPGDTVRPRPRVVRGDTARADSAARRPPREATPAGPTGFVVQPPISPRRAFVYSALVPGLGQTRLRRPNAGALFAFVELGAITMARKSNYDVAEAREFAADSIVESYTLSGSTLTPNFAFNRFATRPRARRTHREDWIALIIFNHLVAGADAFVAAQLWDLPAEVSVRPRAGGSVVVASIPW